MEPDVSWTGGLTRSRWLGRRYLFRVAGMNVPSYTAMLYLGCVFGVFAGASVAGAAGLAESRVALAAVVLLVPALAGARLLYVVQHLDQFRGDLRSVVRRSAGGSALYGGLVASIAVSVPLLYLWNIPFWGFWDAASVTMLVGLIFTRFGCLMHGCCVGRGTSGPFGVWLPDHLGVWRRRFPTPLLEAAWAAVLLGVALAVRPELPFPGALFACVVAAYAAGRLMLEPTRERDRTPNGLRANAALSIALLAAAAAVLVIGWTR